MYVEQLEVNSDSESVSNSAENQSGPETDYRPDSPFLPEPEYKIAADNVSPFSGTKVGSEPNNTAIESPFITEYQLAGVETESREQAIHREIMEELHDEEFEQAVEDLINDVRGVYELQFQGELEHNPTEAERQMELYLAPLGERITAGIDQMIAEVTPIDNEALDEVQLDGFLENFEFHAEFEEPAFNNFFGKIFKKIKKVAKKGMKVLKKVAKKGLKVLKKFSPLHILLGKLKKLVRPLLKRVLKFALNKVPARFRPLAKRLARRFFKGALGEIEETEFDGEYFALEDAIEQSEMMAVDAEASVPSPSIISAEFDALMAGYIIEGEDFDYEPAVAQYLSEENIEGEHAADELSKARDRFIREIGSVESEAEAIAQIEQFIPAILMGLKLGIKIIGRRRVVNFLAKLVAKLIRKFVGKHAAKPLSRALVDAGLRMVSLENPEEMEYASGEVIADTLQETIDQFVTTAPPEAMEDEELMELYVQEAFDRAVAKNFPPQLVRKSLRHAPLSKGTWTTLPSGRRRKHYKKFTERFDVTITRQMAKRILSFGGQTLHGFFKDQLGLPIDKQDIKVRIHLYEGIRGTSLSDIGHLEKGVEGLGSRDRAAWTAIHPLTRRAASLLIPKHVGLARHVNRRFLAKRTRTAVGQRFYYLEIPGTRLMRAPVKPAEKIGSKKAPAAASARAGEVNVTVDFNIKEIRIYNFLSEVTATEIAQSTRRGQSKVALVRAIRASLSSALRTVLSGSAGDHLKIKREVQAEEGFVAGLAPILRFVGRAVSEKVTNFVVKQLMSEMKRAGDAFANNFAKAADQPQDGVTLVFTLSRITEVFAILTGNPVKRVQALAKLRSQGISGSMKIEVKAGFHRE